MAEPRLEGANSVAALSGASAGSSAPSRRASLSGLLQRATSKVSDTANALWSLRRCTSVGLGARAKGRARVENHGSITIGRRFNLSGRWIPVELLTGPRGRIEIGDEVWINFGTVIAANTRVTIGNRSQIGQHCIIADTDFPDTEGLAAPEGAPSGAIEIGDDVWIAGRVTVRPGVKIASGAVIVSGSVVESDVPPNVIAGGIPARVLSKIASEPEVIEKSSVALAPAPQSATARAVPTPSPAVATPAATPAPVPALARLSHCRLHHRRAGEGIVESGPAPRSCSNGGAL